MNWEAYKLRLATFVGHKFDNKYQRKNRTVRSAIVAKEKERVNLISLQYSDGSRDQEHSSLELRKLGKYCYKRGHHQWIR